jgi:uncharacterized OsmC-like protein
VNAVSHGYLPLALFCDGRPLPPNPPTIAESVSPVQYLLIAIASCFALSCRAVLNRRQPRQASFEVITIGEKLLAAPENRLHQISVVAIFGGGLTEADAASLIEEAKPLCTVSNTMFDSPSIAYNSRIVKDGHTRFHQNPAELTAH